MNKWNLCYLLLLELLFSSCDSYTKKLDGISYSVGWVNMPELTGLYYDPPGCSYTSYGIVENRVTDVYWNNDFILAKRCKVYSDTLVGYYVVKLLPENVKRGNPCIVNGPLSEEEYIKAKQELHLDEKEMKHVNIFKRKFLFW